MSERPLADCLRRASTREERQAAVDRIREFTLDGGDLDSLCRNAVDTKNNILREAIIEFLKNNTAEASQRFIDYAIESPEPGRRRWALANLSLMECATAKKAVLHGLRDPDAKVRMAAAMNAGLYTDKEVQAALEHFFSTHRLACVRNFARLIVRQFRQNRRSKMKLDVVCLEDALHSPSVPPI